MTKFTDKWGRDEARARYGKPHETVPRPPDQETPQDSCDKRDEPKYSNNVPDNWLRGYGQEPNFDKTKAGRA